MTDQFVKNRLRSKPITYTVELSHYVSGDERMFDIKINDIGPMDAENKKRVAQDLRDAADRIEADET